MNKQEFNRLAAEFLGFTDIITGADLKLRDSEWKRHYRYINDNDVYCSMPFNGNCERFNPYDDANDMLLLEEKLEIYTLPPDGNEGWRTMMRKANIKGIGKTPHESRRACAEEYLKEWKK